MEIALRVHVVQRISSNISGYTGPIFAIFSSYESTVCIDDGSVPHFPISQGTLPWQPNHLWTSGITQPKNWRILSNISGYTGPIFAIFLPYESPLCTDDGSVFFSKFGQLPSSNLGVYAVKTCNFCSHAPTILGPSSYFICHVGVSKWLEDRNFDFSRVIGKHFCTPYRNLVRFGSVTPEFKT